MEKQLLLCGNADTDDAKFSQLTLFNSCPMFIKTYLNQAPTVVLLLTPCQVWFFQKLRQLL